MAPFTMPWTHAIAPNVFNLSCSGGSNETGNILRIVPRNSTSPLSNINQEMEVITEITGLENFTNNNMLSPPTSAPVVISSNDPNIAVIYTTTITPDIPKFWDTSRIVGAVCLCICGLVVLLGICGGFISYREKKKDKRRINR